MNKENPLSPHIQIYSWNISSLISISHRVVGVVNIVILTLICLWIALLLLGEANYEYIKFFLQSFFLDSCYMLYGKEKKLIGSNMFNGLFLFLCVYLF